MASDAGQPTAFPASSASIARCGLPEVVVSFLYELLDAHHDTARLVTGSAPGESWDAHLDYLRALQRVGRELLADADRSA
jgi:hypothetical protein